MKRIPLAVGALAGSLALLLSGCGGGPEQTGSGTAEDPFQLTFYMDKSGWIESFEAENEASRDDGMVLDVVQTPGADSAAYDSFVRQSFRTDEKPDLFTWSTGDKLDELVEQGMVAETTDIWAEAEAQGLVPDGLVDSYTYDDKQYCVPLNIAYYPVYYNKQVFAENNLQPPTTWAEFTEVATALRDAGETPIHQMNVFFEFTFFQALLSGTYPEAYAGLGTGETEFTDPEVVEVATQWLDMMQDGYFLDPGINTDPQTLLAGGDVAMIYIGNFFTGQLNQIGAVSGEDYGVFLMPKVSDDVAQNQMVVETGPLCVTEGAANQQAALEYSRWWLDDEAQTVWTESRGDVSFNPDAPLADPEMAPVVEAVNAGEVQTQERFQELVPWEVYNRSKEVFGEFVTNAPTDPLPGLQALQQEADTYWAENR